MLKAFRMSKNMTQEQVAKKIGVCRTTVAMWETRGIKPRAERLIQLARLYGCTVDELLAEEDGGKSA